MAPAGPDRETAYHRPTQDRYYPRMVAQRRISARLHQAVTRSHQQSGPATRLCERLCRGERDDGDRRPWVVTSAETAYTLNAHHDSSKAIPMSIRSTRDNSITTVHRTIAYFYANTVASWIRMTHLDSRVATYVGVRAYVSGGRRRY